MSIRRRTQFAEEEEPTERGNNRRARLNRDTALDALATGTTFLTALANSAVVVPGLQTAAAIAKEIVAIAQVRF